MSDIHNRGPIYTAAFASTALAVNSHDFFGILSPTNSRVRIHEIVIGQISTDRGDFAVRLLRGSTASSTSAAITPTHIHGRTTASVATPTAGSSVTGPSTTLVSTASAVQVYADASRNNQWTYRPALLDRLEIDSSQRLHVRIISPSTGNFAGTITFSETGHPAST